MRRQNPFKVDFHFRKYIIIMCAILLQLSKQCLRFYYEIAQGKYILYVVVA